MDTASFLCYYCPFQSEHLKQTIDHMVIGHRNARLKVRCKILDTKRGSVVIQTKDFNLVPDQVLSLGQTFTVDENTYSLTICNDENVSEIDELNISKDLNELEQSMQDVSLNENHQPEISSPAYKRIRTSTPLKTVVDNQSENDSEIEEIKKLLPSVIAELKQNGYLKPWMEFNKLVSDGKFPFQNIAFQLFMDVCRFYACDNTCEMTYSDNVKKFWRIGYKLFHGKFLRFMGGPKHTGSLLPPGSERGNYNPAEGRINFAVPTRSVKSDKLSPLSAKEIQPGILDFLLDRIAECSDLQKNIQALSRWKEN